MPNSISKDFSWVVHKMTSGRFILSVIAGIGFLMIIKTILDILMIKATEPGNTITAAEILAFTSTIFIVIQSVFMSYFSMKRKNVEEHPDDFSIKDV